MDRSGDHRRQEPEAASTAVSRGARALRGAAARCRRDITSGANPRHGCRARHLRHRHGCDAARSPVRGERLHGRRLRLLAGSRQVRTQHSDGGRASGAALQESPRRSDDGADRSGGRADGDVSGDGVCGALADRRPAVCRRAGAAAGAVSRIAPRLPLRRARDSGADRAHLLRLLRGRLSIRRHRGVPADPLRGPRTWRRDGR